MRNRYFFKRLTLYQITHFQIETDSSFTGIQNNFVESLLAGELFRVLDQGTPHSQPLTFSRYGHLTHFQNMTMRFEDETAGKCSPLIAGEMKD